MSPYTQYSAPPTALHSPDYQTFLQLLEQLRKMNGQDAGDASGSGSSSGKMSMDSFSQLAGKMFSSSSGMSMDDMAGAAKPGFFDTPTGSLGGIAGLIA